MENLETIRANYEREYHQTAENLFVDGFTIDTKKEMVEILRKCR